VREKPAYREFLLNTSLFIFPSEFPLRESPPCSLTRSPWTRTLRYHNQCSIHSLNHVCLPKSPKMSPPTYEEKHKVIIQGAPHRLKATMGVRSGSPSSYNSVRWLHADTVRLLSPTVFKVHCISVHIRGFTTRNDASNARNKDRVNIYS